MSHFAFFQGVVDNLAEVWCSVDSPLRSSLWSTFLLLPAMFFDVDSFLFLFVHWGPALSNIGLKSYLTNCNITALFNHMLHRRIRSTPLEGELWLTDIFEGLIMQQATYYRCFLSSDGILFPQPLCNRNICFLNRRVITTCYLFIISILWAQLHGPFSYSFCTLI